MTSRLPLPITRGLSWLGAAADWLLFIWPGLLLRRVIGPAADRATLLRIRVCARYPFQVAYADWSDRCSAPVRNHYDGDDLKGWAERPACAT